METTKFSIHKMGLEDVQNFINLRLRFALELSGEKRENLILQLRQQFEYYFNKATPAQTLISFCAMCEGECVGIGSMLIREQPGNFKNLNGKWGYIMNMYTLPQFRRIGICQSILNSLVEEAKNLGVEALELHATPEGEKVYLPNGFQLHTEPTYRKYLKNE